MQHFNNEKDKANELFLATGKVLKKLREEKGISLNIFAFQNDVQKSLISRLENGKNEPKYLSLWRISEALEMPLSEIIKLVEEELPKGWSFIENDHD